jgi:plasmid maintenance system antidote protein VapI
LEEVTFEVLQTRLLKFVNNKIRNGEYTERGLARVLGISQSQIHNVLKGARGLHRPLADVMLRKFQITVPDLLTEGELEEALESKPRAGNWERGAARKPAAWSERHLGHRQAG